MKYRSESGELRRENEILGVIMDVFLSSARFIQGGV